MEKPAVLYLVIPCYQEEEALPETARQTSGKLQSLLARGMIAAESRILFVNDGSSDRTWEQICALHRDNPKVFDGLCLAHNAGHQNALLAGLMAAKDRCDIAISMDADLQDDIDAIDRMIEAYYAGNEVVYGVRSSRKTDTLFKRMSARLFYRLMQGMGTEIVYDHADFRLMSRRVLTELAEYHEVNLFLRGLVPTIGFQSTTVSYQRKERMAGESKYPLRKMVRFAAEGITSFSVKPLKLIISLGFLMVHVSLIAFIWAFVNKFMGNTVPGWSSTVCSIWLIGGMQLLCMGIVGEYVGKIYAEVKHRPRYIIAEDLHEDPEHQTGS